MIDHIGLSVADYERSKAFYLAALAPLGYALVMEMDDAAGFGAGGKPDFWIGQGQPTAPRVHVAFAAKDRATVRAFFEAARAAGAPDNGRAAPGVSSELLRRVRARSRRPQHRGGVPRSGMSRLPLAGPPTVSSFVRSPLGFGPTEVPSCQPTAKLDPPGAFVQNDLAMSTDATTIDRAGLAERERVLALLRAKEAELRALGVMRLRLFGSIARGEAGPDSDVDLLAEIDHSTKFSLIDHVGLEFDLSELLSRRVDISTAPWKMRPRMRRRVEQDAIEVF